MRLYELISYPGSGTMTRGKLLIESEHAEAVEAVIKALNLTSYIVDTDGEPMPGGEPQTHSVVRYQTTYSGYGE